MGLQLEGARVLYETLLVPVLLYGIKTMICLLGIRRMDIVRLQGLESCVKLWKSLEI